MRMNAPAACCHFSIFIGSFLYKRAKPLHGTVLFINILGKGSLSDGLLIMQKTIWYITISRYKLLSVQEFCFKKSRGMFLCLLSSLSWLIHEFMTIFHSLYEHDGRETMLICARMFPDVKPWEVMKICRQSKVHSLESSAADFLYYTEQLMRWRAEVGNTK